jgi:hypothetical protein
MEEQLPAGLCEGQTVKFVQNDEVHPPEIISHAPLASGTRLRLEAIDEINRIEEKRPRRPARMQLLAMAMAGCVLLVPVPPASC